MFEQCSNQERCKKSQNKSYKQELEEAINNEDIVRYIKYKWLG